MCPWPVICKHFSVLDVVKRCSVRAHEDVVRARCQALHGAQGRPGRLLRSSLA